MVGIETHNQAPANLSFPTIYFIVSVKKIENVEIFSSFLHFYVEIARCRDKPAKCLEITGLLAILWKYVDMAVNAMSR